MLQFEYRYSKVNDGEPSPYSPQQLAISQAFAVYHDETGQWEWTTITISKLDCDQREEHYPNLCWHYLITISLNPTLKSVEVEDGTEDEREVSRHGGW